MKKCPRCKRPVLNPTNLMNSLSRRDDKTYICNSCGDDEAMIDLGEIKPDDVEKEFLQHIKRKRPKGMIRSKKNA